jgi:hypothetical protein
LKDRRRLLVKRCLAAGAQMNSFHAETVKVANACNALLTEKIFTWEDL